MRGQWVELAAGTCVIIVAIGFAIFGLQRGGIGGASDSYTLTASFRSADGITAGTDVRMAGVKVGSVSDITLNSDTFRADVAISVMDGIELPDDTAIIIASEGLLGGNFVELQPGGSPFALAAGDEILNTQGSVSLLNLLMKFASGGGDG